MRLIHFNRRENTVKCDKMENYFHFVLFPTSLFRSLSQNDFCMDGKNTFCIYTEVEVKWILSTFALHAMLPEVQCLFTLFILHLNGNIFGQYHSYNITINNDRCLDDEKKIHAFTFMVDCQVIAPIAWLQNIFEFITRHESDSSHA